MFTASVNAAQDQSQHAPSPRQVHTITDRFSTSNTYLINDGRLFVVDPCSDVNVRLLTNYIQKFLHRSLADIDLIVLTHLHPDLTRGVEVLRRICNAPIAASAVLAQQHDVLPKAMHMLPETLQHRDMFPLPYTQLARLVHFWLQDVGGLPLHPDWRVIASPGRAPANLCLYNPFTSELLCGDTIITIEGRAPLLRRGTNRRQLDEILRVLRSLPVHYVYPGHGRQVMGQTPLAHVQLEL
ncbi:MAG: hypothetical protein NVS4B11_04910 [Ktedonobacteraceae bacterium]